MLTSFCCLCSVFKFQNSARESGAILIMPEGGTTEDLVATESIKPYLKKNAELWYTFVRDKCKLRVDNGDIRVVIGFDKVSRWGIAAFPSNIREPVSLEFKCLSPNDNASPRVYAWNQEDRARRGSHGRSYACAKPVCVRSHAEF